MKKPGVGFGVLMIRGNKVLLGLRNSNKKKASSKLHGEGQWTCPGGKLDFGEKLSDGAKREVKEETNLDVKKLKLISVTDNIISDAHFVTIGFLCTSFSGELKVKEPEEIIKWKWFSIGDLPKNLYFPSKSLIENHQKKRIYKC